MTKKDERAAPRGRPPSSLNGLPLGYWTGLGTMYQATVEDLLASPAERELSGKVQLLFTSPPFPLNRKKRYGNKTGDEYIEWLCELAPRLVALLRPKGSIVLELGNAWEAGSPTMSTLPMEAFIGFLDAGDLHLCQQFVCHNPARLPSPAQWVNVERIRVKDAYTNVWWMSPVERPKANNKRVLVPYSPAMKRLLRRGTYNGGRRPSGHLIGDCSFNRNNGGAIPANVLSFSNTVAVNTYRQYCRERHIKPHPAPMAPGLVEFFIKLLTSRNDLVYDPFGGSNLTGAVAEQLGRRWVTTEPRREYVQGSRGRFPRLSAR